MSNGKGWNPQRPDHRDLSYNAEERIVAAHLLPAKFDLWPHVPPIWDQGNIGSCTAHGSLRAYMTEAIRQGENVPALSRLMQYYDARALEGSTGADSGAQVRDAIKVLATVGCAPEVDWPYDTARFAEQPPQTAYIDAQKYMSVKYQAVTLGPGAPMRTALANGLAITFGFSVPPSFEDGSWDPATEVLPVPGPTEGFIGGHCVTITGYDFTRRDYPPHFIVDNSWGTGWGFGGRFRMDARWFSSGLATDLWCIQRVR